MFKWKELCWSILKMCSKLTTNLVCAIPPNMCVMFVSWCRQGHRFPVLQKMTSLTHTFFTVTHASMGHNKYMYLVCLVFCTMSFRRLTLFPTHIYLYLQGKYTILCCSRFYVTKDICHCNKFNSFKKNINAFFFSCRNHFSCWPLFSPRTQL